jgi:hypothetical protein
MEDKQLEDALEAEIKKSFNDSDPEFEDILNEIENLEKVFSDESKAQGEAGPGLKLEEAKPNDLQEAIDAEVESIATEMEGALDEAPAQGPAPVEAASDDLFAQAQAEVESEEPVAVAEAEIIEETETPEASTEDLASEIGEVMAEAHEMEEDDNEEVAFSAEEIAAIEESVADIAEEVIEEVPAAEVTQDDVMDAVMEQIEATEEPAENVVLFEKPSSQEAQVSEASHQASTTSNGSQVDFNATGSMDLNINFNVAGETANLKVEDGGLSLHMNGVKLTISEETGCSVEMEGGVQFSIPLDKTGAKKNVA